MSLKDTLRNDMFSATRNAERDTVDILKMALAAIKNYEIEIGKEVEDQDTEKILRKEVKKINDSILQFDQMGREDLSQRERSQLLVLEKYLPQLMSEEEIEIFVKEKISQLGIQGKSSMGMLMGLVMKELNGKAEGVLVKSVVEKLLS